MKRFRIRLEAGIVAAGLILLAVGLALADETKYASGTSSAAVTFGPNIGQQSIEFVGAASDKADSVVKFYARGGAGKLAPTTLPALSATTIVLTNTGLGINTNDTVVYVHANGTCDYRTATTGTSASQVVLSSGISVAGATGDYLYEVTQQGELYLGTYGTGSGTNAVLRVDGPVFAVPGDSPIYIVVDGTGYAKIQATVRR